MSAPVVRAEILAGRIEEVIPRLRSAFEDLQRVRSDKPSNSSELINSTLQQIANYQQFLINIEHEVRELKQSHFSERWSFFQPERDFSGTRLISVLRAHNSINRAILDSSADLINRNHPAYNLTFAANITLALTRL